jgi:hypothetical protein
LEKKDCYKIKILSRGKNRKEKIMGIIEVILLLVVGLFFGYIIGRKSK